MEGSSWCGIFVAWRDGWSEKGRQRYGEGSDAEAGDGEKKAYDGYLGGAVTGGIALKLIAREVESATIYLTVYQGTRRDVRHGSGKREIL
jgi:hypothetical protein